MPGILGLTAPPSSSHRRISAFDSTDPMGERSSSDHGSTRRAGFQSRRKRLHSLTSRTKTKAKSLLKLEKGHDLDEEEFRRHEDSVSEQIDGNPAFNPSKAVKEDRASVGGKALGTLHTVVENIAHPIDAVKSKATRTTAGKLSDVEGPKMSRDTDVEALQAHLDLKQVQSSSPSRLDINGHEQGPVEDELRQKVDDIEAHRQSLHVAWVTSRHVDGVRVVPKRPINFPKDEAYLERDVQGNVVRYQWIQWLGAVSVKRLVYCTSCELIRGSRYFSTMHRILVLSILMTLTSCRSISILRGITLNDWSRLAHRGSFGQWTSVVYTVGRALRLRGNGLHSM